MFVKQDLPATELLASTRTNVKMGITATPMLLASIQRVLLIVYAIKARVDDLNPERSIFCKLKVRGRRPINSGYYGDGIDCHTDPDILVLSRYQNSSNQNTKWNTPLIIFNNGKIINFYLRIPSRL